MSDVQKLYEAGENFTQTTFELTALKGLEASTHVLSAIIWRLCVIFILLVFGLIFNIAIALILGDLLGQLYYGFFIVAGFYLLIGLILHFVLYNVFQKPIHAYLIRQVMQSVSNGKN